MEKNNNELSELSKVEIAKEVLSEMIAALYRSGADDSNEAVAKFLEEEREVNVMNMDVVEHVLNDYAPTIKEIERERNERRKTSR